MSKRAVAAIFLMAMLAFSVFTLVSQSFVSGDQSVDNWPMLAHDLERSGYIESPPVNITKLLWKYETGAPVTSSSAVVDGRVFWFLGPLLLLFRRQKRGTALEVPNRLKRDFFSCCC
jgi:hypothetical protein